MEMRTGKTKVVIDEASELCERDEISAVVVVAPFGVYRQWLEQWLEHGGAEVYAHAWAGGTTAGERTRLANLVRARRCLFAINYDALNTERGYAAVSQVLAAHNTMLVLDEAHRIKTPGARRTKACLKLGRLAKFRRILTGTPVANNPLDLFAPFAFLDPRILGYDTFWAFKARYAVLRERHLAGGHAFKEVVGYQHLDELRARLAPHAFSITAAECLGLPPREHVTLTAELSPLQRRLYTEMVEELVTRLDSGEEMSAPLAITQLMRLQQLLGGWFVPDLSPGGLTDEQYVGSLRNTNTNHGHWLTAEALPREKLLLDYLADVPGRVIIWTRFVPERERLYQLLVRDSGYGETAIMCTSADDVKRFTDPRVPSHNGVPAPERCPRYLIASPEGPAAEGVDLSCADTEVYYSNSFKLTARLQSEARPERRGRTTPVTVVDIVVPGTVDERVVAALTQKRELAASFSGAKLRELLR